MEATITRLIERDQDAIRCPYAGFAAQRAEAPIEFSDQLGAWVVTDYELVTQVLHDTERFSSKMPTGPHGMGQVFADAMAELATEPELQQMLGEILGSRARAAVLLNADQPDHRRQRMLVNTAFRPTNIKALEPKMESVVADLLDRIVADASSGDAVDFEIVSQFAMRFPMTIIAAALGVGDDDLDRFKRWSDDLVMPVGNLSPSVDQVRGYIVSSSQFIEYFRDKLAARREQPQDDVISDIANAELDGERLTEAEMLSMLSQFLVAGNETTTNLISNVAYHFATDPELHARIDADRSLIPGYVEEVLRYEAPVGGLFRQAKVDVDVGGQTVRAGEHCWVVYGAANRDPKRFADPDTIDPCRTNLRDQLAFGHGEHFCIGASLARTEGRIATNALLDRFSSFALAPDNRFPMQDTFVLRGYTELHLTATLR